MLGRAAWATLVLLQGHDFGPSNSSYFGSRKMF